MRYRRTTLPALALVASLLLLSGCSLFKQNKCDCPHWDLVPAPERNYDVHGAVPAPEHPATVVRSNA